MPKLPRASALAALALAASPAFAGGIDGDEIRLGLITDLSGPIVEYGNESRNAAMMAVEEINAAGGVHGRRINLIVEDHGYEPRRAMLAVQKLINQDDVFAIVGNLGTATNMAVLPTLLENGVYNFMPQGASPALYDPPDRYKVALAPSYTEMAVDSLSWMFAQHPYERLCVLYQDDDYGRESLHGVEVFAEQRGIAIAEKVSYKRAATDFSSQVARLKAADCDIVQNSSTVRELVASVTEANKTQFKPVWIGTAANYAVQAPGLGGEGMEGIYTSYFFPIPYADSENAALAGWTKRYIDKYGTAPGMYSMYSYFTIHTFAKVAEAAGEDLNDDSFAAALEATKLPPGELGTPGFDISADNRLFNSRVRMAQIRDGRWVTISDWLPSARED